MEDGNRAEYAEGLLYGKKIRFRRVFYDHYITDEEVNGLLQGYVIEIECTPDNFWQKKVRIRLQQRENESGKYFGVISEWKKNEFKEQYGSDDIDWDGF